MPQQKSRKILIYIFLFLIIGTLNNKDLTKTNFIKLDTITVTGLEEKNNIFNNDTETTEIYNSKNIYRALFRSFVHSLKS